MPHEHALYEELSSESFLEYAFLRRVLSPAVAPEILTRVIPQKEVLFDGRTYRIDYALTGGQLHIAIELDGFEFHGNRQAFTYDRLRQNDLHAAGWTVLRFSYDSIRLDAGRCVSQLQAVLALDPSLVRFLNWGSSRRETRHGSKSSLRFLASSEKLQSNDKQFGSLILRHCSRQAQSQDASRLPEASAGGAWQLLSFRRD
ncbi:MAG TPA: DUF559 domain-containing protein [Pyrinomonadaceae bacterium]|nr:DUF559 domain-containing protein [Pyrinomonadaceae bacterium]